MENRTHIYQKTQNLYDDNFSIPYILYVLSFQERWSGSGKGELWRNEQEGFEKGDGVMGGRGGEGTWEKGVGRIAGDGWEGSRRGGGQVVGREIGEQVGLRGEGSEWEG